MAYTETIERVSYLTKNSQRIVICGSMSVYTEMVTIQNELLLNEVRTIVPVAEDHIKPSMSEDDYNHFKRTVSMAYIAKIRDPQTYGVLAVNFERYDIPSYIGANTFAEIAVAFAQRKKVYILCGIPEFYSDELRAWRAIDLRGDLTQIIQDYKKFCKEDFQLRLF
jgi:hypothetical protein